jgi:F0F1-type ATP synthase epsilon subunit
MSGETFERKVTTPAEREARKAFRQVEAEKATKDHKRAQKAFHDNLARLKAERLAREAARR